MTLRKHNLLAKNLDLPSITRLLAPPISRSILLDLNNFISSPSINVNPRGDSAILSSNPFSPFVFLEHNPAFDPAQIIPEKGLSLKFKFKFVKAPGGDDEFGAFLIDQLGAPIGSPFEFFTVNSSKGIVSFDLSSLSSDPVGLVIILTEFNFKDDMHGSSVEISNVGIFPNNPTEIPIVNLQTITT